MGREKIGETIGKCMLIVSEKNEFVLRNSCFSLGKSWHSPCFFKKIFDF